VMWPLYVDCYDEAVRGVATGIGLRLDRCDTIDPDDATDKVETVLADPSYRERAEQLSTVLRAAGGCHTAAELLLDLPTLALRRRAS